MSKINTLRTRRYEFEFPADVVACERSARADVKAFSRRARSAGLSVSAGDDGFVVKGPYVKVVQFVKHEIGDEEMALSLINHIRPV
jgi:hypothetical protein